MSVYKFIGYVPKSHLEQVKTAIFHAGAGHIGNYSHCSWQTLGQGQFLPLSGANPAIGQVGTVETVLEWQVQTVVPKDKMADVLQAYKDAHPYETPAYEILQMVAF